MPQQPLTEDEFNAIVKRAEASMPKGVSEGEYNKRIDDEVSRASAVKDQRTTGSFLQRVTSPTQPQERRAPVAGRGTGYSQANKDANLNAMAESAPEVGGMVGGAVGNFTPVGPIGGAAIGGSLGSLVKDANRYQRGNANAPTSLKDVALGAGWEGGKQGLLGVGGEVVGKAAGVAGDLIANRGVPLVRSALKIPLAMARQRGSVEGVNPNIAANRISKFIVDEGLSTPEAARELIKKTGSQVDEATRAVEANPNVSTVLDTANRIPKYIQNVLDRGVGKGGVEKQLLPRGGRSAIQDVGKELVEDSPLSQYVPSTARKFQQPANFAKPSLEAPSLTKPSFTGEAITEIEAGARPRALRANVRPSEALETIREKSFFDPAAGEANILGKKTAERALRDSFKEAVPDAAAPLLRQGRAMDAERVLDRMAWRDAGRDQLGFPAVVGAAGGKPGMGLLMQFIKNKQLQAGIAAPKVGRFVAGAGKNSAQIQRAIDLMRGQSLLDQILSQDKPE